MSRFLLAAVFVMTSLAAHCGPALKEIKANGCRNIWISVDDAASIKRLADNGFNAATAQVGLLKDCRNSAGRDDPFILREADIPQTRLELVRAQVRECAKHGLLYMAYINQLSDYEVLMWQGKNYRHVVNDRGVEGGLSPCPLERKDWLGFQLPQMLALARILAKEGCDGGIMIEGETYCAGDIYPGYNSERQQFCYCDYCWQTFLKKLPADTKFIELEPVDPATLKRAERYAWLSTQGLLWRYEQSEREELAKLMRELAAEVRKVKPDCLFGMYPCSITWYNDAIAAGLSTKKMPFLVYSATEYYNGYVERRGTGWDWSNAFSSADQIRHFKQIGANLLYQGGLSVGTYWPQRLGLEMTRLLEAGDGFWIYWGGTLLAPEEKINIYPKGTGEYGLREKSSLYWPKLKKANVAKLDRSTRSAEWTREIWKDVTFKGPDGEPVVWDADNSPGREADGVTITDTKNHVLVFYLNSRFPPGPGSMPFGPKSQTFTHQFAQAAKTQYLYGANVKYEGPPDGARIGLGWSFEGHREADDRQIFRYVNSMVWPDDGWTWLVRPLEVVEKDQLGWVQFLVQANPGQVMLRSLFLSPCSVTTIESPTIELKDGQSWGRVAWNTEGGEKCYSTLDVYDAAGRQLYADIPNGFDLKDISRVYGLKTIRLKFTCHVPAGTSAKLRYLRVGGD